MYFIVQPFSLIDFLFYFFYFSIIVSLLLAFVVFLFFGVQYITGDGIILYCMDDLQWEIQETKAFITDLLEEKEILADFLRNSANVNGDQTYVNNLTNEFLENQRKLIEAENKLNTLLSEQERWNNAEITVNGR